MAREIPTVPTIAAPEKSPVGFASRGRRRELASQIKDQVFKELVDPFHDHQIDHTPRPKMYVFVPGIGDHTAEKVLRLTGSGLLGNRGRISARMRHTGREGKTQADIRHAFKRFEHGALNDDGYLPFMEQAMSIAQTSKFLKSIDSLGAVGAAINSAASILIPIMKLMTSDSARAKVTSLWANPILAAFADAIDSAGVVFPPLAFIPTAFYLNAYRLENGFDMGDQIADLGQFVGYKLLLDHEKVSEKQKKKIAQAFMKEYTKGEGPEGPRPSPQPVDQSNSTSLLDKALQAGRTLESIADLPGVGETLQVGKTIKNWRRRKSHEERSMRERVNDILTVADHKIAQQEEVIATHARRLLFNQTHDQAQVQLVTWQYRKAIATMLRDLSTQAQNQLDQQSGKKATNN